MRLLILLCIYSLFYTANYAQKRQDVYLIAKITDSVSTNFPYVYNSPYAVFEAKIIKHIYGYNIASKINLNIANTFNCQLYNPEIRRHDLLICAKYKDNDVTIDCPFMGNGFYLTPNHKNLYFFEKKQLRKDSIFEKKRKIIKSMAESLQIINSQKETKKISEIDKFIKDKNEVLFAKEYAIYFLAEYKTNNDSSLVLQIKVLNDIINDAQSSVFVKFLAYKGLNSLDNLPDYDVCYQLLKDASNDNKCKQFFDTNWELEILYTKVQNSLKQDSLFLEKFKKINN